MKKLLLLILLIFVGFIFLFKTAHISAQTCITGHGCNNNLCTGYMCNGPTCQKQCQGWSNTQNQCQYEWACGIGTIDPSGKSCTGLPCGPQPTNSPTHTPTPTPTRAPGATSTPTPTVNPTGTVIEPKRCLATGERCSDGKTTGFSGQICCNWNEACLPSSDGIIQPDGSVKRVTDWTCSPKAGRTTQQACSDTSCETALGVINFDAANPFGGLVKTFFSIILSVSGGIAVLLIIYSGYRLIVSQGNPEQIQQGREQLAAAIIGLLFIIFSLVALQFIGVDILGLPTFSP